MGGCAGTDGGRSGNWVGRPGWVDRGWVDRAGRAGGSSRPRRGSGRLGMEIDGVAVSRYRAGEPVAAGRSEEHTSELQSLMRISYAVFCLKKKLKRLNTLLC